MKKMILISIILMSFMSFAQEDFGNSDSETDLCLEVNDTQAIDKTNQKVDAISFGIKEIDAIDQ